MPIPSNLSRTFSLKEENTLCLIAQGIENPDDLRLEDVSRLQSFGFVEVKGERVTLPP
jgi:hypothetical protein